MDNIFASGNFQNLSLLQDFTVMIKNLSTAKVF